MKGSADIVLVDRKSSKIVDLITETNMVFDSGRSSIVLNPSILMNPIRFNVYVSTVDARLDPFQYWNTSKMTFYSERAPFSSVIADRDDASYLVSLSAGPFTTSITRKLRVVGLKASGYVSAIDLSNPIVHTPILDLYVYYKFVIGVDTAKKYWNKEITLHWGRYSDPSMLSYVYWYRSNATRFKKYWYAANGTSSFVSEGGIGFPLVVGITPGSVDSYGTMDKCTSNYTFGRGNAISFTSFYKHLYLSNTNPTQNFSDTALNIQTTEDKNTIGRVFIHNKADYTVFAPSITSGKAITEVPLYPEYTSETHWPMICKVNITKSGTYREAEFNVEYVLSKSVNSLMDPSTPEGLIVEDEKFDWPTPNNQPTFYQPYVSENGKYFVYSRNSRANVVVYNLEHFVRREFTLSSTPFVMSVSNEGEFFYILENDPSRMYVTDMKRDGSALNMLSMYTYSYNFVDEFPTIIFYKIQTDDFSNAIWCLTNLGILKIRLDSVLEDDWVFEMLDASSDPFRNLESSDFCVPDGINDWWFIAKYGKICWLVRDKSKLIYWDTTQIHPAVENADIVTNLVSFDIADDFNKLIIIYSNRVEFYNMETLTWEYEWGEVYDSTYSSSIVISGVWCYIRYPVGNYSKNVRVNLNSHISEITDSVNYPFTYGTHRVNRPFFKGSDTYFFVWNEIYYPAHYSPYGYMHNYINFASSVPIRYGYENDSEWTMGSYRSRQIESGRIQIPHGITLTFGNEAEVPVPYFEEGEYYTFGVHPHGIWIDPQQTPTFKDSVYFGVPTMCTEERIVPGYNQIYCCNTDLMRWQPFAQSVPPSELPLKITRGPGIYDILETGVDDDKPVVWHNIETNAEVFYTLEIDFKYGWYLDIVIEWLGMAQPPTGATYYIRVGDYNDPPELITSWSANRMANYRVQVSKRDHPFFMLMEAEIHHKVIFDNLREGWYKTSGKIGPYEYKTAKDGSFYFSELDINRSVRVSYLWVSREI